MYQIDTAFQIVFAYMFSDALLNLTFSRIWNIKIQESNMEHLKDICFLKADRVDTYPELKLTI